MTSEQLNRRQVLQLSGAATVVALAGCLGGSDDPADHAEYASAEDGEVALAYLDIEALAELEDTDDEPAGEEDEIIDDDEALLALPTLGAFVLLWGASFSLGDVGLADLVDDDAEDEYETEVDELLLVNDAVIVAGSIDTDEVETIIKEEAPTEYEETDGMSGYTFFEPADDDDEDTEFGFGGQTVVAVDDGELIAADEREQVETVIETLDGDRTSAVDEFADFEWLMSVIEESQMALAGYNEDGPEEAEEPDDEFGEDDMVPAEDVIDEAFGFAGGVAVTDDELTAKTGIVFESIDDDVEAELESEFSSESADVEFDFDDDRVTMSATFAADKLE